MGNPTKAQHAVFEALDAAEGAATVRSLAEPADACRIALAALGDAVGHFDVMTVAQRDGIVAAVATALREARYAITLGA